jgi:hypothetical protein
VSHRKHTWHGSQFTSTSDGDASTIRAARASFDKSPVREMWARELNAALSSEGVPYSLANTAEFAAVRVLSSVSSRNGSFCTHVNSPEYK